MHAISKMFSLGRPRSSSNADGGDAIPALTEAQARNVGVLVEALDAFASSASMYTVQGDEKRINDLTMMLNRSSFTSNDLDAFVDVELNLPIVGGALREYLSTHAPLIPTSIYEDFINPYASLADVLFPMHNTGGYHLLEKLVYHWANFFERHGDIDGALNFIQNKLGLLVLRAANKKRNEDTVVERYTAFSRLLKSRDTVFHRQPARDAPRRHSGTQESSQTSAPKADSPGSPGRIKEEDSASVPDRSVKVTVPKGEDPLDDDALFDVVSSFGEVVHIGSKGKSKFVLFTRLEGALRCMREWDDENNTFRYCKVAYLGNAALLETTTHTATSNDEGEVVSGNKEEVSAAPVEEDVVMEVTVDTKDASDIEPVTSAGPVSGSEEADAEKEVHEYSDEKRAESTVTEVTEVPTGVYLTATDEDQPVSKGSPEQSSGSALGAPRVWADAKDKRPVKAPKPKATPQSRPPAQDETATNTNDSNILNFMRYGDDDDQVGTPVKSEPRKLESSLLVDPLKEPVSSSPYRANPIKDLPRSPDRREPYKNNDDFKFMTELPAPSSSFPAPTTAELSPTRGYGHSSDVVVALNRWGRLNSGHVLDNVELPSAQGQDDSIVDTIALKLTRSLVRDEGGAYQAVLRRPVHLAPRSPREEAAPPSPPPARSQKSVEPSEDKVVQKSDALIVQARPALIDPIPENNRRATHIPASIRDQFFKSSAPTSLIDYITDDNAHVAILESRVRSLEAEIKARIDSARLLDAERKRAEEQWAKELSAAKILAAEREAEVQKLNDTIRSLRSEQAHREGELTSLRAITETQEASLKAIKSRADREAMSTVLSQQRLISLLESERDELTKKASSLTVSNVELEEENKKLQLELMDWRTKAIASDQLLQNIVATHADLSAHVAMGKIFGGSTGVDGATRAPFFAEKVDAVERAKSYLEKKHVQSGTESKTAAPETVTSAPKAAAAPVHVEEPARIEQTRAGSTQHSQLHIADMVAMKYAGGVVDVSISNRIRDELMTTRPWLDNLAVPRGRPYGGSSTPPTSFHSNTPSAGLGSSGRSTYSGSSVTAPTGYRPKTKELQSWIRGEY